MNRTTALHLNSGGFTVSFAEGKIFVSDEGRAFARYELSHFCRIPVLWSGASEENASEGIP